MQSIGLLAFMLLMVGCKEPPQACLSVEDALVDQNYSVDFSNCSIFLQAGYLWDFGDGSTSDQVSPSHAFAAQGEYLVSLTALGDNSANDDVATEVIEVGRRIMDRITVDSLPDTTANGGEWDAGDGPDVFISIADSASGGIVYSSSIFQDVALPSEVVVDALGLCLELMPAVWQVLVGDDDGGAVDTMAFFTLDLDSYVPGRDGSGGPALSIALSDSATGVSISYVLR